MATFNKVAVLGKGTLGSAVVAQLASAGFAVTVLTRQDPSSITSLPQGVQVTQVDYTSQDSLISALRGHDAVICTVGMEAVSIQKPIIDASIAAGVRRFIPSDFGSFTHEAAAKEELPFLKVFADVQDYLAEKAKEGKLEYTHFATGSILEMVLAHPMLLDFMGRKATLYDRGNHPISTSRLSTVAQAITSALSAQNAAKTANRTLFVHDALISQRRMLAMAKRHSGKGGNDEEWSESYVDGAAEYAAALEANRKGDFSQPAVFRLVVAALLTGRFEGAYLATDNEMLGLGSMRPDEIEAMVAASYQG